MSEREIECIAELLKVRNQDNRSGIRRGVDIATGRDLTNVELRSLTNLVAEKLGVSSPDGGWR